MQEIYTKLLKLQDQGYRDFQAGLLPTLPKEKILGIRMPAVRKLAKEIQGTSLAEAFLQELPHKYYDENQLHAVLLSNCKGYEICMAQVKAFLPYIDNWATCDLLTPKIFKEHIDDLLQEIPAWLGSEHSYTARFGIRILMEFCLDTHFNPVQLQWVANLRSEEYYVRMGAAWYFATALAKQYNVTVPLLEQRVLDEWTHRKTIQKACESYRITAEQKQYLRSLR
ncbi:DNA alkylation repair protein [Phascolarctobacterium sp.]|uniref:DNA alkylation repair protein n=1 Tax=Phascolarctobacterium sp. TaxID=2049039 RepID=UPI0038655E26